MQSLSPLASSIPMFALVGEPSQSEHAGLIPLNLPEAPISHIGLQIYGERDPMSKPSATDVRSADQKTPKQC